MNRCIGKLVNRLIDKQMNGWMGCVGSYEKAQLYKQCGLFNVMFKPAQYSVQGQILNLFPPENNKKK